MKIMNCNRRRPGAAGYNPLSAPSIYGRWRANDWDPSVNRIPNTGASTGDTTRDLQLATGGTYVAPDFSISDPLFNGFASIGSTSVTSGRTVGFINRGNVNFTTSITTACTVYGVYYINAPPSPSTCYLRGNRTIQSGGAATALVTGSPGLYHFSNFRATRDNVSNVGGSSVTGLRIVVNVYNGASSATYVNAKTTATATGTCATTTITSLGMGNPNGQASLWRMSYVLLYSAAHGTTDRQNITTFLGGLYGVATP